MTIGIFDDRGDLNPVDLVLTGCIEVYAEPPGEDTTRRCRRREKANRLGTDELLLYAGRKRTPQRNAAVTVVVIVEVAEHSLIANEETRLTVTCSLVHLGQRERNPPHAIENTDAHNGDPSGASRRHRALMTGVIASLMALCL
jgi:hypothetical protein